MPDYQQMFHQVLKEELIEINKRRRVPSEDEELPELPEVYSDDPQAERVVQREALNQDLTGLALSGGGIRSATFALGVLQGLASFGLLRRFDYLSTVSGGGYIGSWLAAWIKREGDITNVEKQLSPTRVEEAKGRTCEPNLPLDPAPEPLEHLRAYTSYLAPRQGVFSADSFVLGAIYLRNILLNQLVLLPACLAALLLTRFLEPIYLAGSPSLEEWLPWLWVIALSFAVCCIAIHAVGGRKPVFTALAKNRIQKQVRVFLLTIIAPLLVFAFLISRDLAWDLARGEPYEYAGAVGLASTPLSRFLTVPSLATQYDVLARRKLAEWPLGPKAPPLTPPSSYPFAEAIGLFGSYFAALVALSYAVLRLGQLLWAYFRRQASDPAGTQKWLKWLGEEGVALLASGLAGFTGGALLYSVFAGLLQNVYQRSYDVALVATLGPPLAVLVVIASIAVAVGVLGTILDESRRESWASLTGWLLIFVVVWIVVVGTSLSGPVLIVRGGPTISALLGSGWIATAWAGVMAGWSARTRSGQGPRPLEIIAAIAPPVFLLGFLALLALGVCPSNHPPLPQDGQNAAGQRQ